MFTIFNHCWILLDIPCVELRSVNCCPLEISIDFPGVHCKLPLEIAVHWKLLSIGNEEVLHFEIWNGKTDENTGFGSVRQIAREPNHKPNHEEKCWNTRGNCWGRVMLLLCAFSIRRCDRGDSDAWLNCLYCLRRLHFPARSQSSQAMGCIQLQHEQTPQ